MQEIDFAVPKRCELVGADRVIETICLQMGLTLTLKGSLAKYPGCIHWHYRNGKLRGTLELTLCATNRRIWAKIQAGRRADWIEEVLPTIRKGIETGLRELQKKHEPNLTASSLTLRASSHSYPET